MNANKKHPVREARNKVKTLNELRIIAKDARTDGLKVVLAHGVYDLVHMGHVRHLEAARREGDLLIVTTTADHLVNKGPGRPIFAEELRAEMLAALEYVDWVGVSKAPSAETVLDLIKPDVYVKGSDYENPDEDVTGNIVKERETVEKHGGRVMFTKDISFSSSELINKYLDVYDRPLKDYLDSHRDSGTVQSITQLLESVKDYRVLLVGDAIIDEYQYVQSMGKSPKENMIASRSLESEIFAGGVFASANHVADFCAEVEIITVLGTDDSYEGMIRENLKPNVTLTPIYRDGAPTTRKCRFIESGYLRKLFEVYYFDGSPPDESLENTITEAISEKADKVDLVIAHDFGHGMLTAPSINALSEKSRFLAVNTQTNSANLGYNLITKYPRMDFVCIDAPEAQLAAGDRFSDIETIVSEQLSKRIDCDKFIVTHGQYGCVVLEKDTDVSRIPAFTKTVVDTVGAGDAFLAVSAPLAATGAPMELVGIVGNAAGAMKVSIVGHRRSVEKIPLLRYITTLFK
jgi:rfaE bifunctional protein nucleotidyltransferase chain/domain